MTKIELEYLETIILYVPKLLKELERIANALENKEKPKKEK